MALAEVLGHQRTRAALSAALRSGRLPPAVLFTGPPGVGKKRLAMETARALLCETGAGDTCGTCAACRRSGRGLHSDLFLVEPEGASIKIERVRDVAREILGRPFEARARGFVIDEAHLLTEQAANALLKSLEEPPATSHVFLVTASPQALLPTVRSRCQVLRMGSLPQADVESYLRERCGLGPEEARLRAVLSGGSLGAALAFEADAYRGLRAGLLDVLEKLPSWGPLERVEAAERLEGLGAELPLALSALRSLLRDVAVLAAGGAAPLVFNADVADRLGRLAAGPLGPKAAALAGRVGEIREGLRTSASRAISMDVLLEAFASELRAA